MLCQIEYAFLVKFAFSYGNKETIGKISLRTEATNSIVVLHLVSKMTPTCKWPILTLNSEQNIFQNEFKKRKA